MSQAVAHIKSTQRKSSAERHADQLTALDRTEGFSENDGRVIAAFSEQGISATPRLDVLTFKAWLALGRSVSKGERATKVPVFLPVRDEDGHMKKNRIGRVEMCLVTANLFHVSQTRETPTEYRKRDGWQATERVREHRRALGLTPEPCDDE